MAFLVHPPCPAETGAHHTTPDTAARNDVPGCGFFRPVFYLPDIGTTPPRAHVIIVAHARRGPDNFLFPPAPPVINVLD